MTQVLILGAGVIGLQTANTLLDAGLRVTILAKHWPGDESIEYTSPWAGAIWRTHATPDQAEICDWNVKSYREWMRLLDEMPGKAQQMGLQRVPLTIYSDDDQNDLSSPRLWYSAHVHDFSLLSPSSIVRDGPKSGHSFLSIVINPDKYLRYLDTRARGLGARTIVAELPATTPFINIVATALASLRANDSQDSGFREKVIVVNCTGISASTICADESVFPIRGQTALVRITPPPPTPRVILHDTTPVTYIVPRPLTSFSCSPSSSTYLFGGTNDADDWNPEPAPGITENIVERCKRLMRGWADNNAQVEVLREQVGLRPGRKCGVRIEVEEVNLGTGEEEKVQVVHQYGHAGAGFQCSIGSAMKVLGIIESLI